MACSTDLRTEPAIPAPWPDRQGIAPLGGASFKLTRDGAVFAQRDARWRSDEMGMSGGKVGDYGCTLSAVAMAAVNLGEATDPGALNTYLSRHDGYTASGLLIWDGVRRASAGRLATDFHDTPSAAAIDQCLREQRGFPIVQFMISPRVAHWVVIVGKDGTRWQIRDPLIVTEDPIFLDTRASTVRAVRCVRLD